MEPENTPELTPEEKRSRAKAFDSLVEAVWQNTAALRAQTKRTDAVLLVNHLSLGLVVLVLSVGGYVFLTWTQTMTAELAATRQEVAILRNEVDELKKQLNHPELP